MNDTKDDKTLSVNTKKTLTLKRPGVEQGTVRQNFSHGRTKAVVVETKKRKFALPGEKQEAPPPPVTLKPRAPQPQPQPQQPAAPVAAPRPAPAPSPRAGMVLNELSTEEMEARRRALQDSKVREVEERKRAAEEAQRRAEEDERRRREREESARRQAEEEARLQAEAEARRRAEEDAKRRAPAEEPAPAAAVAVAEEDEKPRGGSPVRRGPLKPEVAAPKPVKARGEEERRRGKLTLTSALAGEDARARSLSAMRRRQEKFKRSLHNEPREKISREVVLPETITIQELANRMAERAVDIVKFFMKQGQMMKPGDVIDADTAELVAAEFGHTVKRVAESDVEEGLFDIEDREEDRRPRPPVVTIMGHVDHGKTSLLDAIRDANVVSGEHGGITQHIGAYQVEKNGTKITFLDTPGHEAFTAMRARGAQATDIAVLVVAADDGVMPQTIESIKHAKAAGVPIIVAINKMDKPESNPQRVRTELLQHEVFVETMGGDVLDVEVSAKTRAGLDKLLETILLQAEVLELKVARDGRAEGIVVEAKLDRGRGAVATVLVQRGTLRVGDILVAGTEFAKVRALINDKGEQVKEAGPSVPVEVLGFTGVPSAGDRCSVVETEARAREVTEYRQRAIREKTAGGGATSLEQMMNQLKANGIAKFPLIIKGDVQGSVEAIVASLEKLGTDEVSAQILHQGVGGITESDVTLATASKAVIIGFNVRANKQASELAGREGIEIRYYNIIYDLIEDVKGAMSGLLAPERRETFIGYAKILEVFQITKVGKVAGCQVTEGIVERGAGVRLLRDNVVIHEGKLKTLKRFKDEVKEVQTGQECGMAFENYEDIRANDVIECFRVETVQRTL
jgi:translation initiation factor IF-2